LHDANEERQLTKWRDGCGRLGLVRLDIPLLSGSYWSCPVPASNIPVLFITSPPAATIRNIPSSDLRLCTAQVSASTITMDRKGPAKAKIYPGMFVLDGLAANQYNPRW